MKQYFLFFLIQICLSQYYDSIYYAPETSFDFHNSGDFDSNLSNNFKKCDINCLKCDDGVCKKCIKGLFLFNSVCYNACPFNTFADNPSFTCNTSENNPVYIKAYTNSRCLNSCGKTFQDCSCSPKCKKFGDCCSDYKFCEIIEKESSNKCYTENCKFCTSDRKDCLQCKDNFYYYKNNCFLKCPKELNQFKTNRLCYERCSDLNCEKCEENSKGKCVKCLNGFFLFKGNCYTVCPIETRANKIDFTCNSKKEFSFYWTFPSKSSCNDKCGFFDIKNDCSCRVGCMRRGNCCDDFEKECRDELQKEDCKLCNVCINGSCLKCKENAFLNSDNNCLCESGYSYDIEEDICLITESYNKRFLKYKRNEEKNIEKIKDNQFRETFDSLNTNKTKNNRKFNQSKLIKITKPIEKSNDFNNSYVNNNNKNDKNSVEFEMEDNIEMQENDNNLNRKLKNLDLKNLNRSKENKLKVATSIENIKDENKENIIKIQKRFMTKNIPIKNSYLENMKKYIVKDKKIKENINLSELSKIQKKNNNYKENRKINLYPINRNGHQTNRNHSMIMNEENTLADKLFKYFNNIMKLLEERKSETKSIGVSSPNSLNNNQIMNLYMNGNISINILEGNNHSTLNTNRVISSNSNNNLSSSSIYNNSNNSIKNTSISSNSLISKNRESNPETVLSNVKTKNAKVLLNNSNRHLVSLLDSIRNLHPNVQLKSSFLNDLNTNHQTNDYSMNSRISLLNAINSLSKANSNLN